MNRRKMELMDRYIRNELNAEEKVSFVKEMEKDPALKMEVALLANIKSSVTDQRIDDLEVSLNEIRKKWESKTPERRDTGTNIRYKWYGIAAAIGVLVASISLFYFFLTPSDLTAEQLFEKYYQPFISGVVRSYEPSADTYLQQAFHAYNNQNYHGAIRQFDSVLVIKPGHFKAEFYKAHCHINLDETKEAIVLWEKILQNPQDNSYIEEVYWYLTLAYLKKGNPIKAKEVMDARLIDTKKEWQKLSKDIQELVSSLD